MKAGTHRQVRRRTATPRLRLVLAAVKASALGALLSLLVVAGIQSVSPPGSAGAASADDAYQRVVERAATDHRCSFHGFDDAAQAASALIRTEHGNIRVVSFEKGWDVYNGKRPGNLIAVCLDDRETPTGRAPRTRPGLTS